MASDPGRSHVAEAATNDSLNSGARQDPSSGSLLARAAEMLVRRPRPWRVLLAAVAIEAACMVAIGSVQNTRHVLGIPGSVMALCAVVAGALGGPIVGLVSALAGGAVYATTVASFGVRGAWPATIVSIALWSASALVAATLADALRGQSRQSQRALLYNRGLLEASLDSLVTIGPDGAITDVNEATERVTGVPREQLIGTDFSDYFTAPHEARAGYEQVFERGLVIDYPLAIRHASGEVTDVLYNATVYRDEGGAVVGVFAAARDVTERKRAEESLLRAEVALRAEKEELARSNAELEQFAYVASHDLQEPLRMVASYTQLLARRYEGRLDQDADEFIGYAVDGATRMQQLISDLLAFSRVGTRGNPLLPMDAQAAYAEAVGNLALTIEESGATVSADPLPMITGDYGQIVQLLQNLIGNAVKFHGEAAPRVHLSVEQRGSEWAFSLADNGIGIDPQYFERIFVIFQRLQGRGEFPGTGIGLALCKKIVARHNGRIWVESEPGRGTTFRFTIPIQGEDRR
jgi:PAS domain S-box-containing protein